MSQAIYRRDGDVYAPNEWAGGPWSPLHQHGGAVAALLRAVHARPRARDRLRVAASRSTCSARCRCGRCPGAPLRAQGTPLALAELSLLDGDGEFARQRAAAARARRAAGRSVRRGFERYAAARARALRAAASSPGGAQLIPPGFHWSLELRTAPSRRRRSVAAYAARRGGVERRTRSARRGVSDCACGRQRRRVRRGPRAAKAVHSSTSTPRSTSSAIPRASGSPCGRAWSRTAPARALRSGRVRHARALRTRAAGDPGERVQAVSRGEIRASCAGFPCFGNTTLPRFDLAWVVRARREAIGEEAGCSAEHGHSSGSRADAACAATPTPPLPASTWRQLDDSSGQTLANDPAARRASTRRPRDPRHRHRAPQTGTEEQ